MNISAINYGGILAVDKPKPLTPAQIARFRADLSAMPQVEHDTENYFIPNGDGFLYCRKVMRPANIATLGRVHKQEHFYIVAKGRIAIRGPSSDAVPQDRLVLHLPRH
jgi:hypothetical protein